MRLFPRICLLCALALPALAQTTAPEAPPAVATGSTYVFTRPVLVSRFNLATLLPDTPRVTYLIPASYRFTVVKVVGATAVIKFVRFTEPDTSAVTRVVAGLSGKKKKGVPPSSTPGKGRALNRLLVSRPLPEAALRNSQLPRDPVAPAEETLFFAVPTDELLRNAVPWQGLSWRPQVAAGTVILPVKMRLAPFDFSRDFALGLTVGARWRISRYQPHYVNALFAFNANIVTIDSLSTGGRTRRATDLGALGTAVGAVLDFNGPQVGIFSGLDWLSRRDQVATNWHYQGRPWLSVGVGFTLFTRNGSGSAAAAPATQSPH